MNEDNFEMLSASQASGLTVEECKTKLYTNVEIGLSINQVNERRRLYGKNELIPPKQDPIWKRYLAQFKVSKSFEFLR
jgi:magnesium-transporting ATPase (P-type)